MSVVQIVNDALADAERVKERQAADALQRYVDAVRRVAAGERVPGDELLEVCRAIGVDASTVFPGDVQKFAEALRALAAIKICEAEIPELQQQHSAAMKAAERLRADFDAAFTASGRARANLMDMNHRRAAAKSIVAIARNKHPRLGAAKEFQ